MLAVVSRQFGVAQRIVKGKALIDRLALDPAHMPGIPAEMVGGILDLENFGHPHADAAADFYIVQFAHPAGQGGVERHRMAGGPAVINPVPRFDDSGRLIGSGQLGTVDFLNIHRCSPPKVVLFCRQSTIVSDQAA